MSVLVMDGMLVSVLEMDRLSLGRFGINVYDILVSIYDKLVSICDI